jgi:hypothetical protein
MIFPVIRHYGMATVETASKKFISVAPQFGKGWKSTLPSFTQEGG